MLGIGLHQCVAKWRGVCNLLNWGELNLQTKHGGGAFGKVWRKKVNHGKGQWCIINDRFTVYTPRQEFETILLMVLLLRKTSLVRL